MESFTKEKNPIAVALSIAGSDSGETAGVQADLAAFAANRAYGTTATVQNPTGITGVFPLPPKTITAQIKQVTDFCCPNTIKNGMLYSQAIANAGYLVIDPVIVSTSGAILLEQDAIDLIQSQLLPLDNLITPNLDGEENLWGRRRTSLQDIESASRSSAKKFDSPLLIQSGHLEKSLPIDTLSSADGEIMTFQKFGILSIDTLGTGCKLSSAITASLAVGASIESAVREGLRFFRAAMEDLIELRKTQFIRQAL